MVNINKVKPSLYLVVCVFLLMASTQLFNPNSAFIAEASRDIGRREALGVRKEIETVRRNQGPVNGPHSPHDHSGGGGDPPLTHY